MQEIKHKLNQIQIINSNYNTISQSDAIYYTQNQSNSNYNKFVFNFKI